MTRRIVSQVNIFRLVFILGSCFSCDAIPGSPGSSQDPSSYANVDQFAPTHISFDFDVNFVDSSTSGTVMHRLTVLEPNITTVYFDVWDVVEVSLAEFLDANATEAIEVPFEITKPNPKIGNALAVTLSEMEMDAGDSFLIRFTYKSLPETTALSWMTPEQTAGKVHPFVYSLCQMNFCRDWAPMMDTPSQKITYDSRVVAPKELFVSMSGNQTSKKDLNATHSITTFECNEKIPSYQLALIVGDLTMVALSDRVVVLAEAPYIEAATREFEDLPALLDQTEDYLTPYIWGNYSIVVMPPSFPWGGMEHINANQVSHTLITGDKSMLYIAIHEITHSWFGNDVGCQNWNHFWINEGLNVFMERKILEDFYDLDYAKIEYYTGNTSMVRQMIERYGLNHSYSSLFPNIGDDDPENSFSGVPYEKGSQFMFYIETLIGPAMMQTYLRDYINHFHGMAISSPQHKVFYEGWINAMFPETATDIINATMWDTWVYEPGVAPVPLDFYTQAVEAGQTLAQDYLKLGGTASPENYTNYFDYFASQKSAFVHELSALKDSDSEIMAYIDGDLNITLGEANPSVKSKWYILGIKKRYQAVWEPAHKWMGEQGLDAYVTPTFRALVHDANDCPTAQSWFAEYEMFYNTYVRSRVAAVLKDCNPSGSETPAPSGETTRFLRTGHH